MTSATNYFIGAFALAVAAGGCRHAEPIAEAGAVTWAGGMLTLPAGSPMLQQITQQTVGVAELPTDEVVAPGKIEANPNRVSRVVLPVSGRISRVLVKAGDAVKQNQALLTIVSPDADAAMSTFLSADAAVTQAQAALAKAQSDFDRASDLFEHNAVAKKDTLAAESALAQANGSLQQARAGREQAARRLSVLGLTPGDVTQEVVLRSPLAGKVLELSVVQGEFRNDTSASVMTIADLSTVWVTSQVPESYIRFVQTGERVEVSLVAYPGETFEGRVAGVADVVDAQTRTVKVHAELLNPTGRFRPEMFGSIHHIESTAPMAIIPEAAVIHEGDRTVVFLEHAPGHFEQRAVTIGKPSGSSVRVLSGVKAGDSIVVDGLMLLEGLARRVGRS
jgi:cobalt-zinc-cadmium efflux system membrane fusion protein